VVADRHGIETHRVHERRIGLARFQGVVERAGDRVPGVQLEHVRAPRRQRFDRSGHARESTQLHGDVLAPLAGAGIELERRARRVEIGMMIVDVKNR